MCREVMHDPIFLAQKSEPATRDDLQVAQDLLDTLIANKDACVGMAANMIGVCKRIIVFDNDGEYMTMFNPEIIKQAGPYETEEGCLSLLGAHASVSVIRPSRCSGKTSSSRPGSKPLPAGRRRSSSTRLITAMEF